MNDLLRETKEGAGAQRIHTRVRDAFRKGARRNPLPGDARTACGEGVASVADSVPALFVRSESQAASGAPSSSGISARSRIPSPAVGLLRLKTAAFPLAAAGVVVLGVWWLFASLMDSAREALVCADPTSAACLATRNPNAGIVRLDPPPGAHDAPAAVSRVAANTGQAAGVAQLVPSPPSALVPATQGPATPPAKPVPNPERQPVAAPRTVSPQVFAQASTRVRREGLSVQLNESGSGQLAEARAEIESMIRRGRWDLASTRLDRLGRSVWQDDKRLSRYRVVILCELAKRADRPDLREEARRLAAELVRYHPKDPAAARLAALTGLGA